MALSPVRRSIVFEVVTRVLFPVMIFSIYLLIAGHNAPGGGFAGGLVAGLALVIRYLAGWPVELDEAAPVDAGRVLGAGLIVATSAGGRRAGARRERSCRATTSPPIAAGAGAVHLVTSVFFDVGVYLVVIGVMLDLARSLGAGSTSTRTRTTRATSTPRGGDRPMSPNLVLPVIIGGLYAAGVYLLLERSLTRILIGVLLLATAEHVVPVAGGPAGGADHRLRHAEEMSDPLPQAMVLTAIVITLGVTAFCWPSSTASLSAGHDRRSPTTSRMPAGWPRRSGSGADDESVEWHPTTGRPCTGHADGDRRRGGARAAAHGHPVRRRRPAADRRGTR